MAILITGSTGNIGSEVIRQLLPHGVELRGLVRGDGKALPKGVKPVIADMTKPQTMREAMRGVRTLFMLNAVVADELTQVLQTLDIARSAGVDRIVYISVLKSDVFLSAPHFAVKRAAEQYLAQENAGATILRPTYFMQNDARLRDALKYGVYPMPIGSKGIAMVDTRDVAEAAAKELLRRHTSETPLPIETFTVCGPDAVTGESAAKTWSTALGNEVRYGGDDLDAFEKAAGANLPDWQTYDLRIMFRDYIAQGQHGEPGAVARLTKLLGHAPRSYGDFVRETAAGWKS